MSVFNTAVITATRNMVPCAGVDCSVPNINSAFASGGRITSPGFLVAPKLLPGTDQVLIHGGDQSVLIDQTQYHRIRQKRDTEIELKELYVNQHDKEHQTIGPSYTKHHKTTTSEYVGEVRRTYFGHYTTIEKKGFTRVRDRDEKTIYRGNQTFLTLGGYMLGHRGLRYQRTWGNEIVASGPGRIQLTGGLALRAQALDSAMTGFKASTAIVDFKERFLGGKNEMLKAEGTLAKFAPGGAVVRLTALCIRLGAALGTIRW